jgi:catechol 2,3-dioxygenase-like lactoylglutathione lyase family enzyme
MKSAKNAIDVGFVSANVGAMLDFYRDTLGLEYVEAFTAAVGTIHRLRFGASFVKIIESTADRPVTTPEFTYADLGLRYLTFETPDIEDVWNRAILASAPVVSALHRLPGGSGQAGTVRDPDGNLVELLCRSRGGSQ